MIRASIVARGKVQKVGYRDLVQDVARSRGIKGYVENLRDGNVRIVCEGEKEVIDEFMKAIKVDIGLIRVESIELSEVSKATGEFQFFDIKYGPLEEELSERMVAAVNYAAAMWEDIKEMRGDIKEIRGDIKEMLKKQDQTITEIRELRIDIRAFIDERLRRIEKDIETIKVKIGLA